MGAHPVSHSRCGSRGRAAVLTCDQSAAFCEPLTPRRALEWWAWTRTPALDQAEDWRDDYDLGEDELDESLAVVDPELFAEHRKRQHELEEGFLHYHREFRARKQRVPEPGWRSEYVEEVANLGYETLLGD